MSNSFRLSKSQIRTLKFKPARILSTLIASLLIGAEICGATCGCHASARRMIFAPHSSATQAAANDVTTNISTAIEVTTATNQSELIADYRIIEGDIMIRSTASEWMSKSSAMNNVRFLSDAKPTASSHWPNGTLYYSLTSEYTPAEAEVIAVSLLELQLYVGSAVTFKRVSPGQVKNYVAVFSGSGCSSFIGRQTGAQAMSLERTVCLKNYLIQHEFMHALGYWHEHSRLDRDRFVTIMWNSIDSVKCANFAKAGSPLPVGYPAYDTNSIMHYNSYAFSCNGRSPSITTKSAQLIPYPIRLAHSDLLRIRYYYGFGDNTTIPLSSSPVDIVHSKLCVTICITAVALIFFNPA